ncbi:hypothetical protein C8R44DRAFT_884830 [Mycena epipterygia]|nr:hypothetical protein C8R44DRAFT_884830 [Mycena epipterygia]
MGSKRYVHERRACLAGYLKMPSILSAMSFELRHLPRVTSRLVRTNGRIFELWSPNSAQIPFFPGVVRPNFFPEVPRNPSERRYDGHVGVHDCLHTPQYLRQDVGHWPFMRRITHVDDDDYAAAAFAPLTDYWRDVGPHTLAGRLDPEFIDRLCTLSRELQARMSALRHLLSPTSTTWENRPAFASVTNLEMLRNVKYWEEAVDLGVALQRSLREMDAWVSYVGQQRSWNALNLDALRRTTMDVADEQYIGGWINGTSEDVVLRYMLARVPCFVVHEYQSDEMPRSSVCTFPNFLQNTEVEALLSDMNPYQQIARRGGLLDSITTGDDGRGMAPFATAEAERRSSSVFLESLPSLVLPPLPTQPAPARHSAAGGWGSTVSASNSNAPRPPRAIVRCGGLEARTERFGYPRAIIRCGGLEAREPGVTPARKLLLHPPTASHALALSVPSAHSSATIPAPASNPRQTIATSLTPGPSAPPSSAANRFEALPLERRTIEQGRVDWIVPPPIAAPNPNIKDWEHWELADELYDCMMWTAVGKAKAKNLSYPLTRYDRDRKRILHLDHYDPPPGVLDHERFGEPVPSFPWIYPSGDKGIPKHASRWMYKDREAKRGEVGKLAIVPSAASLPLIESAAEGEMSRGKGKAAATEDDDDEEELGVADVPEEGGIATCVIVLDGLDDSITAVMFRAFARDALWNARAEPTSIVHGQGRIWVRFVDATGGLRAFGSLHSLGYDVRASWASLDDFEEAARYSRDLWTPETTAEEAAAPGTSEASDTMEVDYPVRPPSRLALALVTPEAPSPSAMDASSTPPVTSNVGPTTPTTVRHPPSPVRHLPSPTPPPREISPQPLACTMDIGTSVSTMRQLQLSHLARPSSPISGLLARTSAPPPSEPRAMRQENGIRGPVKRALEERFSDPRDVARRPLEKRFTSPLAASSSKWRITRPRHTPATAPLSWRSPPSLARRFSTPPPLSASSSRLPPPDVTNGYTFATIPWSSRPPPPSSADPFALPPRGIRSPSEYYPSPLPLAERFPLHPAQGLIPLPLRLAPEDSPCKRPWLDKEDRELGEPGVTDSPAKKRVRRGRRAGRVIQDAEARRKAREAQAEALMDVDNDMANEDFVEWVATLDAVAEAEAQEEREEELVVTEQKWSTDDDDDPPIAGC